MGFVENYKVNGGDFVGDCKLVWGAAVEPGLSRYQLHLQKGCLVAWH